MGLRKTSNQYRPYSNCVTLRGQLANWTSADIVEVATKNIETIIEPIRGEITGETMWDEIEESENKDENFSNTTDEFGTIGDSLLKEEDNKEEQEDYGYEWCKL